MNQIHKNSQPDFAPVAADTAVVVYGRSRFTILTSRLIRLEYSPNAIFEDRPSQVFWYRRQPIPEFELVTKPDGIEIITRRLHLQYTDTPDGFGFGNLTITLRQSGAVWRYGDRDKNNLRGTRRTLDRIDGAARLEPGLMSRKGWAVVDDSETLVFNTDGWLESRQAGPNTKDLYFFGYGQDYQQCLADYCHIAGGAPLLPRWALGNWWSRYWEYSAESLAELMETFRAREVPLSVCIIDMDWHLTDVEGSTGWTGYTWNRELFREPAQFIAWLHAQGVRTALNLHPAEGVWPHEEMYPAMARRLGLDPSSQKPIPFDIANPDFTRAYFELLHHPQEEMGIDFWWIDWQQGELSALPGLDPLFWLNHLHFYDLGRNGRKRPFIFSRWGGLGNHRYPIGFSGDTRATWQSLAFQPEFTATAANVGYSWWSHDIGGHMDGKPDAELFVRWVQYGVFSPILRLHSTKNPFNDRHPWGYGGDAFEIVRDVMQLRHALIPYLYTQAWRNSREHLPPIRPMYHDYPTQEDAYHCPQQYTFGAELLAAPFTSAADPDTRLSRQAVWLPEGEWYDFFSGRFMGAGWRVVYGRLEDIPVFAPAGAIMPLALKQGWGGIENPVELELHIFAGADHTFTLYEDDGDTMAYAAGAFALTTFSQTWTNNKMDIRIAPLERDNTLVPDVRQYTLYIIGVQQPQQVTAYSAGQTLSIKTSYDSERERLIIELPALKTEQETAVTLIHEAGLLSHRDRRKQTVTQMLHQFSLASNTKAAIFKRLPDLLIQPERLHYFAGKLTSSQILALQEGLGNSQKIF